MSENTETLSVCIRYNSILAKMMDRQEELDAATKELIRQQLEGVIAVGSLVEHGHMDVKQYVSHMEAACEAIDTWLRPPHRGRAALRPVAG